MDFVNMRKGKKRKVLREIREFHSPTSGIFFMTGEILLRKKSDYQLIEIIANEQFGNILFLDGLVQTTEKDEFYYHEMLVHPAFVCSPQAQRVLIIGGGDGGALREVLRYPIEEAYLVEIDGMVIEAAKKYFPWLETVLKDNRSRLLVADGAEFLKRNEQPFDIIIVDSSEPIGPSAVLHQEHFYLSLKNSISEDGVIVMQAGSPFYHLDQIREISQKLKKIFKIVRFYLGPVPTYPGGYWSYVFLSNRIDPLKSDGQAAPGLKYFSREIHKAAFVLPEFFGHAIRD